jgi:hypothetical protein
MGNDMRDNSARTFDPRAWNLFVGATLGVCGCNNRPLSSGEVDETSTSTSTAGYGTPVDLPGPEPDCQSDADCEVKHVCVSGYCYYDPGECPDNYGYDNCDIFEICEYGPLENHCVEIGKPPPDCEIELMNIPTVLDPGAPPRALRFVDVDADGQDELVVATETELLVYEAGSDQPVVTDANESLEWMRSMVAWEYDDEPGEDLLLLIDQIDRHYIYVSDGVSGFLGPLSVPSPMRDPSGLFTGDFDGQAPIDLLLSGLDGVWLSLGGDSEPIVISDYGGPAAMFEHGSPYASLLLGPDLRLFDLQGAPLLEVPLEDWFGSFVAASSPDQGRYAGNRNYGNWPPEEWWNEVRLWNPTDLTEAGTILLPGNGGLVAADLDGDQVDELIVHGYPIALVVFDPLTAPCTTVVEVDIDSIDYGGHAVGDHDGNGDDELALGFAFEDTIVIIDGE